MQRRAAAAYAAFFLLLTVGAYGMIAVAEQPTVSVETPDYTKEAGETLTTDGRAWTVGEVSGGSTELSWINASERQTTTIENGTVLSPAEAHWQGQRAASVASLRNGSVLRYEGSDHEIRVASVAFPRSLELVNLTTGTVTTAIEVGGSLPYRGNETTVVAVTPEAVTVAWGDSYRVLVPNASNPTSNVSDPSRFAFRQVRDVERHLRWDPAVENETVTRADGKRYVVYRETNRTEPLSTYVPPLDVKNVSEGESFVFRGNEATVENVTAESVVVAWHGPVEQYFTERINGLWAVVILSGLAAIFVLGGSYLPSRY